jgi:hypothetical protein
MNSRQVEPGRVPTGPMSPSRSQVRTDVADNPTQNALSSPTMR